MTRTGRAVIAQGQKFEIREYTVPDPEPGKVLLRQELAGICGTDLHYWQNGIKGEMVMGHENVGVIEAIGAGGAVDYIGRSLEEGDRVIFSPGTGGYGVYGFYDTPDIPPHFYGGFADYIYLGLHNTCILKTDCTPDVAVLTEPFTIGVHAAMRGNVQLGDTVVVQGSGAIGLVTLLCAKQMGAAQIIMVGGPATRLELAKRFGADVTINIEEVKTAAERTDQVLVAYPFEAGRRRRV